MGNWQLDPYHTQVEFAAKHLGMMTVRGHFADVTSTAEIDPDHLESMRVEVTIQTASIKTHHPIRDNDLRSSNFLVVSMTRVGGGPRCMTRLARRRRCPGDPHRARRWLAEGPPPVDRDRDR